MSEVDMGCVYQRGKIWWIKFQDANGEPQYRGTKAATKAEARISSTRRKCKSVGRNWALRR